MRYTNYADRHRIYVYGNVDRFINSSARLLRDEIVTSMEQSNPSGRIYLSRRGDGSLHQASAPGEVPAIDTHEYADSWKVDRSKVRRTRRSAAVYSDKRVGRRRWILALLLEHGTERMLPRPHIRRALEKVRGEMRRRLQRSR